MKKRVLALILCMALSLSGCSAMLERGRETMTTHVDYAVTEDDSILRAESYQGLVNAMLYFINNHWVKGTIRLYNYTGDVDADLANARDEVLHDDPIGAFSVRSLRYDATRILTYYEVELRVGYSRTAQEVNGLREVTGLAGVRQELARLVSGQGSSAVFLASYFSGDRELVEQLLNLACYNAPELFRHHDINQRKISLYPETGTRRVIKVELEWNESVERVAEQERDYAQQLETVAAALLEANPPEGEGYTAEELAAIVRAANGGPDYYGTSLALYALSGEPASDFGLLMAMEYLCRQCGVEAEVVNGSTGMWLIVADGSGYRHLLPAMLSAPPPPPEGEEPWDGLPEGIRMYTDQELAELGWEWDAALYPACTGSAEPS